MNWLFGCFGGADSKARKHAATQTACRNPSQTLPANFPLPPHSTAVGGSGFEEQVSSQERTSASSAIINDTHVRKISERTLERQNKGDPCPQFDAIDDELEDLRKQIEQETIDTQKIREEVTFLRSCGTLLQTPVELRKRDKNFESEQHGTPSQGWHSWLLPPSSMPSNRLSGVDSESRQANEGMEPIFCPADATYAFPSSLQSPILENAKNSDFLSESSLKSQHGLVPQMFQPTKSKVQSDVIHPQSPALALEHELGDFCVKSACLSDRPRSPHVTIVAEKSDEVAKQCLMILMIDSVSSPPVASARDNVESVACSKDTMLIQKDQFPCSKMSEAVLPQILSEETRGLSGHTEQTYGVNSVLFPCERDTKDVSTDLQETPRFLIRRNHMYENSNYAPEATLQCASTMETTGSKRYKSSSRDYDSYLLNKEHFVDVSVENLPRRPCFVEDNTSCLDISMCSSTPQTDSEKALTDLNNERSLVNLETPQSYVESIPGCGVEDSSSICNANKTASTLFCSHSSTQNSVAQAHGRLEHGLEYGYYSYGSENNPLSGDTFSPLSVDHGNSQTESVSAVSTFERLNYNNLIITPNSMTTWQDTPEALKFSLVRTRASSLVLAPVENSLYWRQSKRMEAELGKDLHLNDHNGAKAENDTNFSGHKSANQEREEGWDENDEPEVWRSENSAQLESKCSCDSCFPQKLNGLHVECTLDNSKRPMVATKEVEPQQALVHKDLNERPILGLLNGNLNPSSTMQTGLWDGKGIPNTTTKYKEDQRVNWHASPFEARLERALHNQGKPHKLSQRTPMPTG